MRPSSPSTSTRCATARRHGLPGPPRVLRAHLLTKNLGSLSAEVVRRLTGIQVETSAVFNLSTQFGGGKTHALTLLYHLAQAGPDAHGGRASPIQRAAQVERIPHANTAVFVGTEFDSITGRGGDDGTPLRKTPWGEIAFQLGGDEAFNVVAEHDAKLTAPGGDVISQVPARRQARADPARRADELRQPQPQERTRRPALQLSCRTCPR